MVSDPAVAPSSACPAAEELTAFTRGQLPPQRLETIAEHLDSCTSCASALHAVQVMDALIDQLRGEPERALLDEPACSQLQERACAIPRGQHDVQTVSDAQPARRPSGPPLPADFGAYVLLEELGHGGMGIVYKARHRRLDKLVALKLVRAGVYASTEERTRFEREARAIARIRHPHVVQIFDFGEQQGQLFFSMELLEAGTLTRRLRGQPLPQREAAELVRTLALAVAEAHRLGVWHRDLKPGNVLFAADGPVKITDFGLAKVLDDAGSDTCSEAILGTPAYMAPEQARGETRKIGPSADVYALGAILYETLTGRPLFQGETRSHMLALVRDREPDAPSHHQPGLARDLEAICLKCLEKEPGQRYPSAAELADDLDRWLSGETTRARPQKWPMRLWRSIRRRPRVVSAAALLLLLAIALLAGLWYRDPERPRRAIEAELARGRSQTLIGETGLPVWYRWQMGGEATHIDRAPDSACSLHTWTRSLLELVRDPQLETYRFRVEVRHEKSNQPGNVGLYFAHRTFQAGPDVVHYYGWLAFDDINDERVTFKNAVPNMPNPQPAPTGNPVFLRPEFYSVGAQGEDWGGGIPGLSPTLFEAAGHWGGPWRRLVVEVTPSGVRGYWGAKEDGKLVEVGELTAEGWVGNTQTAIATRNRLMPEDQHAQSVQPQWLPRGSLGLYLYRGSASFRRVVVEPLNPSY
jgi:serine/threonine-protein kinase